jgi:uncharacterized protein (DUF1015 family)
VRKHERTRAVKEDDRTRHILAVRAQTGPVFLTYRASGGVDAIVTRTQHAAPLFDFDAPDAIRHTIWRVGEADSEALVAEFARIPALYIADGHHRAAAAARARATAAAGAARSATGSSDMFLAVAFPHDQVQVLPYNRIVRDLNGLTAPAVLEALRARLDVRPGTAVPARREEVSMFLGGGWHTIALGEPLPGTPPDGRLDVSRLQDLVLGPILGIADPTRDPRIDFVGGIRGTGTLEDAVRTGSAAVAFSLHAVSVDDIMAISDAGGIMPPKSSWFEPKLRDGLLIHAF